MGKRFSERLVQNDIKLWPFKVATDPLDKHGDPLVKVQVQGEEKQYSPVEISAFVVQRMKQTAEAYLGGPVSDCVITYPAHFTHAQRVATEVAGTAAGLKVLRTINEPTSAAIAFGLDGKEIQQTILIFDLGGGTFDVTIMK